ncbi:NADH:flavin oxidoreductase [Desulfoferrobacter suflitae]|uniref:NADH:flavin oxidoreductase n=1 Tax=Desulfoferrobacter suflitae TaxID=2865782 RepID=UPI002164365C|nr:NADH:flavin oxidoreductase [Desulfoferrobacter suflitae]MCK8603382.1 NADH:flavin oxidoreductase [Desulfoferrobacter suflitae]
MSKLFDTTSIGTMTLANRFVRSATWEGMAAKDGAPTQKLMNLMVRLAEGGVGLIITGHAYVSPEGQAGPWQLGIHRDDFVEDLQELTNAVHDAGGKIVMQIAHAGCHANTELSGLEALGPSVVTDEKGPICREMSPEEIDRLSRAFGEAALRALRAGFDGVQMHAAHGYLLSQFLSPFYNQRSDRYGGSLENRMRFVMEAYREIRQKVGPQFPVLIKMNSEDFVDRGLTVDEMLEAATALEQAGIDAVELSGGTMYSGKYVAVRRGRLKNREDEVYYLEAARQYKARVKTPLMLVGGIRSLEVAEHLVNEDIADYISLARPLIREPDLVNRWKSGDRARATCQSDNLCFKPAMQGEGIYCVTAAKG